MNASQQRKIIKKTLQAIQVHEHLDNLERSLLMLSKGNIKDLSVLGTLVYKYSEAGKLLAKPIIEIAKNHGDIGAEYAFAQISISSKMHSYSYRTEESTQEEGIGLLKKVSDKKFPPAMYSYGKYLLGKNEQEGMSLMIRAAKAGHAEACAQVGNVIKEKDPKRAIFYFEKAHAQGLVEATFQLGVLLWDKDPKKAVDLYMQAANKGLAVAQHNVADIYFKGIPSLEIKPQLWKATEYWSMAAEQFFQPSLMNLGKFYLMGYRSFDGKEEIPVNHRLARDYLERTVALGGTLANEAKELLENIPSSTPTSWFNWFK